MRWLPSKSTITCTIVPDATVVVSRQARKWVEQQLFGISRQGEHLVDLSVAGAQPRRLALGALGIGRDAQRQATGDAEFAMPAISREAANDMIAGFDRAHLVADRLDHAGRLMAGEDRKSVV